MTQIKFLIIVLSVLSTGCVYGQIQPLAGKWQWVDIKKNLQHKHLVFLLVIIPHMKGTTSITGLDTLS